MGISRNTATNLQDEIIGPINFEENREEVTKRMKKNKCLKKLAVYKSSKFQHFESCFRTEIDLVERDIRLVLHE